MTRSWENRKTFYSEIIAKYIETVFFVNTTTGPSSPKPHAIFTITWETERNQAKFPEKHKKQRDKKLGGKAQITN